MAAELVAEFAREHGESGPSGPRPERLYYEVRPKPSVGRRAIGAGAVVALVVGAATLLRREAP